MSENTGQNKTELPTEQRLKKSREEGQVARSKELNTALLLLLGSASLLWFADLFMQLFYQLVQSSWQLDKDSLKQGDLMTGALADALLAMLGASMPFLLTLFIASWVAGMLPGGAVFSGKLLGPKFSNMDPIAGLGRMFGLSLIHI